MTSIVKTVFFCASNNIPLHGHSAGKGNFMKLLQFRMDAGDEALKKHFAQMAGNAKYISPTIQNEILGIASTMVVEEFVAKANESFISVVADESCNISGKNNLALSLTLSLPRSSIDDLVFSAFTSNFVKFSYKISLIKNRFVTLFFIRFSYNFQKITLISSRIGRCTICDLILGFLHPKRVKNTNNPVADDKIVQILSTCQLR